MKQETGGKHDEGTERRRTTMKKHDIKWQWTEKIKAAIEEARRKRPEQVGLRPRKVWKKTGKPATTDDKCGRGGT